MSDAPKPVRIVLLYGGQSAEHDVSRRSASSVLRAIDRDRYDVVPIAITLAVFGTLGGPGQSTASGPR